PAPLLHLPPFPTRRSSDLHSDRLIAQRHRRPLRLLHVSRQEKVRERRNVLRPFPERWKGQTDDIQPEVQVLPKLPGFDGLFQILDRKSTRLNSSHVSISYA